MVRVDVPHRATDVELDLAAGSDGVAKATSSALDA